MRKDGRGYADAARLRLASSAAAAPPHLSGATASRRRAVATAHPFAPPPSSGASQRPEGRAAVRAGTLRMLKAVGADRLPSVLRVRQSRRRRFAVLPTGVYPCYARQSERASGCSQRLIQWPSSLCRGPGSRPRLGREGRECEHSLTIVNDVRPACRESRECGRSDPDRGTPFDLFMDRLESERSETGGGASREPRPIATCGTESTGVASGCYVPVGMGRGRNKRYRAVEPDLRPAFAVLGRPSLLGHQTPGLPWV